MGDKFLSDFSEDSLCPKVRQNGPVFLEMPKIYQSCLWSPSSTVQFCKPKNFVALGNKFKMELFLLTFFKR